MQEKTSSKIENLSGFLQGSEISLEEMTVGVHLIEFTNQIWVPSAESLSSLLDEKLIETQNSLMRKKKIRNSEGIILSNLYDYLYREWLSNGKACRKPVRILYTDQFTDVASKLAKEENEFKADIYIVSSILRKKGIDEYDGYIPTKLRGILERCDLPVFNTLYDVTNGYINLDDITFEPSLILFEEVIDTKQPILWKKRIERKLAEQFAKRIKQSKGIGIMGEVIMDTNYHGIKVYKNAFSVEPSNLKNLSQYDQAIVSGRLAYTLVLNKQNT